MIVVEKLYPYPGKDGTKKVQGSTFNVPG